MQWRAHRHVVEHDQFQGHCSSYKERIALREREYEQTAEGPDKEEKRRALSDLRQEYDQFLEAWQQKQELAKLVPRGSVSVDAPKLPPGRIAELVELLAGSARLPADLLTASDYLTRGNAYYGAGDYERALEAYSRSLELVRNDPDALDGRAIALGQLGRSEEALENHNHALDLRPNDPYLLNNRGVTLSKLGRHPEALQDMDRAVALRPNHPTILVGRAGTHSLMGHFAEALRDLEAAIRGDKELRNEARTDTDFEKLRNDPVYGPRFWEIVGREDNTEG